MRPKLIIANWKMHQDLQQGVVFSTKLVQMLCHAINPTVQIVLLPPFIHLEEIRKLLPSTDHMHLGAQNCHEKAYGAFTGEVSAPMLRSVGARFVLIGHSERRNFFGEDSTLLARKVTTAINYSLRPIFCCGESKQTREESCSTSFVHDQLVTSLFHLSDVQMAQVIIAYEPVWAIGTGNTPTPMQVQAMHQSIRKTISQQYGEGIAQNIPILYGGSCNAQNAPAFFACADVDGGLIGKASLEIEPFLSIVSCAGIISRLHHGTTHKKPKSSETASKNTRRDFCPRGPETVR
mmetsp:Transcript_10268/g.23713  ORF Transcript_10268/g.23713 Transcript_10268/m.23713 type:complete len:292 (+) Transcript_10268:986-1861(+)